MPEAYVDSGSEREKRNLDFVPLSVDDLPWLAEFGPSPEEMTPEWLEGMSIAAEQGAKTINPLHSTHREIYAINNSRHYFYSALGLDNEDHELHAAYRAAKADRQHDIPTQSFIGVARLLHGKGVSVCKAFKNAPTFFGRPFRSAAMKISYLEKTAAVLGWDGETAELIERNATILTHSRRRLGVIARVMAMADTPKEMPTPQDIARLERRVGRLGLEIYVNAGLKGRFTDIKEPPAGSKGSTTHGRGLRRSHIIQEAEQYILRAKQNKPQRRLLNDYFSLEPPRAQEVDKYPVLWHYLPKETKNEIKTRPENLSLTAEDWLWLSHFGDFTDHTELNKLFRTGSQSRLVQTGYYETKKERVLRVRLQFFRTLADKADNARLTKSLEGYFSRQKRLPATITSVEVFRTLAEANINIVELLGRYPAILNMSKEKLEKVFGVFKEYGVNPAKIALKTPILLGFSVETLAQRLEFLSSHGIQGEAIEERPTLLTHKPDKVLALLT